MEAETGDVSPSPGAPVGDGSHQELGGRLRTGSPRASGRNQLWGHLDLGPPASRRLDLGPSLPSVCGPLLGQPQGTNTGLAGKASVNFRHMAMFARISQQAPYPV